MPKLVSAWSIVASRQRLSAAAIIVISLLPLVHCDSHPKNTPIAPAKQPARFSSAGWEREATRLLESGDCIALRKHLGQRSEREPLWYELMSQAHMTCWRRSSDRRDFDSAIRVLDAGLLRFPRSANLLLSKGYRYLETGDVDLAKESFRAAESRARENLRDNVSSARAEDQSTAEAASQALAQQIDPSIIQRRFEHKILQLIAGGDCVRATRELRSAPSQRRNDGWYDLLYVSNHNCFAKTGDASYQQSAQTALTEGLDAFPASPRLLLESAAVREEARDFGTAIKLYQAALASPEFDKTFVGGRATIEERVGRLKSATK